MDHSGLRQQRSQVRREGSREPGVRSAARASYNCGLMSLTSGTKLGPYVIVSLAGAGGMGEVYRARDGRLNREVAIKVLPAAFARDPERLFRRFSHVRTIAGGRYAPRGYACRHHRLRNLYGRW